MSFAEKTAYAEELEEKLQTRMIKIAHYDLCVLVEIAATLALNQFQKKYTRVMINRSTLLQEEEDRLEASKTKAWNDRFAAESEAYPPTLESILWIVAKSGFTEKVVPFMNLSKATRECKNLQRYMREARNERGKTQLFYYCQKGMTSSVVRMLEMRSIDVKAKYGEHSLTCLHVAAMHGHLDICRLLLDKGAQLEEVNKDGMTALHFAASQGSLEMVCLLCDRGADVESRSNWRSSRPLHLAAYTGKMNVVKELIEEKNAVINARDDREMTALGFARLKHHDNVIRYLTGRGGID